MRSTVAARGGTWSGRRRLILLTLMLAGCSSAPAAPGTSVGTSGGGVAASPPAVATPSAGARTMDICGLISATEITGIVDKELSETTPGNTECTWAFNEKGGQIPGLGGNIYLRAEGNDTELTGAKTAWPDGQDVAGIGDRAYWVESVAVLYFVTGGVEYACQLILFDETEPRQDIAKQVAQLMISRV